MSLNVSKKLNGTTLEVALDGSLDTLTAPQLEEELGSFDGVTELIFDYENLTYISSAGLRVMVG